MSIDWENSSERAALSESIGIKAYNKALKKHRKSITVNTVGGHAIRKIKTQFGLLYAVGETNKAFRTRKEAEDYAGKHSI